MCDLGHDNVMSHTIGKELSTDDQNTGHRALIEAARLKSFLPVAIEWLNHPRAAARMRPRKP